MSGDPLAVFGTEFEELEDEKDGISRRKPLRVEEQEVRDERGRRRFHGAFTGGFSAGYFNTVGSKDGWAPTHFKSSRAERQEGGSRRPEDFMDEHDTGDYGIAPRRVRPTKEFDARHFTRVWDCPLVRPVHDSAGAAILMKMGWRRGKGIGGQLSHKHRDRLRRLEGRHQQSDEDDPHRPADMSQRQFAPDDVELTDFEPKTHRHGLGYRGISGDLSSGRVLDPTAVSKSTALKVGKRSRAFGVGAFEDQDDDIYTVEDLSKYDFSLGSKTDSDVQPAFAPISDEFVESAGRSVLKQHFAAPKLPRDYKLSFKPRRRMAPTVSNVTKGTEAAHRQQALETKPETLVSVFEYLKDADRRRLMEAKAAIEERDQRFGLGSVKRESGEGAPPSKFVQQPGSRHDSDRVKQEPIEESHHKINYNPYPDDPKKQKYYTEFINYAKKGL